MGISGVGIGALMDGVMKGGQFAQGIKQQNSRQELLDMQMQDLKNERATKQGAKDLAAQGIQDANAHTDGQIDNVMNYYMQNQVPKLQQYWMANGDVQKAEAFGKWAQDANVQQGMRYSAGMMRAAQLGDPEGVMDNMVKLYNQPGYFEDGQSAVKASLRRDDKGNAAGMDITLRNDKTGEETTHTFESMDDVYKLAAQFGTPDQVFKFGMDQLQAGQKATTEAAKEGRDWQRKLTEKEIDQNYRLETDNNQSQLRRAEEVEKTRTGTGSAKVRDAKATISFLKENGASDDYIRSNMAGILGIENRSRPVSSRIDDYIKMRTESDRKFGKMPLDEQIQEARSYISTVDKQSGEDTPALGLPGVQPTTGQQPAQQGDGLLFLDTKTGKIISR